MSKTKKVKSAWYKLTPEQQIDVIRILWRNDGVTEAQKKYPSLKRGTLAAVSAHNTRGTYDYITRENAYRFPREN